MNDDTDDPGQGTDGTDVILDFDGKPDDATWAVGEPTVGETRRLILGAVGHIKSVVPGDPTANLEYALSIGTYLFEKLFRGDPAEYDRKKNSGLFKLLLIQPVVKNLKLHRKTLQDYIRVAILSKDLPTEAESLLYSNRRALLPLLARPAIWKELAVEAAKNGWTVVRLEAEVTARLKGKSGSPGHEEAKEMPKPDLTKATVVVEEIQQLVATLPKAVDKSVPVGSSDLLKERDFIESLTAMHELLRLADSLENGAEMIAERLGTPKSALKYPPDIVEQVADFGALKGFLAQDEAAKVPAVSQKPDPADTIRVLQRSGARVKAALLRGRCPEVDAWAKEFVRTVCDSLGLKLSRPTARRRKKIPWFVIYTRGEVLDPEKKRDVAQFFADFVPTARVDRCVVQAETAEEAEAAFRKTAFSLIEGLPDPVHVDAELVDLKFRRLKNRYYPAKRKKGEPKSTIRYKGTTEAWLTSTHPSRPPNLDEYVESLKAKAEAPTPKDEEKEKSP